MWTGGLPTKAGTSPTWGPPPPYKQALILCGMCEIGKVNEIK